MAKEESVTRLLVVDDEEDLLWTVSHRLKKERPSFVASTTTSGHEALSIIGRERVDALVADLRMPGMNGIELVFAARAIRPQLPVVVMTAYPSSDVLQKLNEGGSIEFIEKPFDFGVFLSAIERAIARTNVGFSGAILVQTLPDVIQLYALSNSRGALLVSRGGQSGTIWFERGTIPHAITGDLVGAEAFYEIISWQGGTFAMRAGEVAPQCTIALPWMELVMEGCRRTDERARSSPPRADTSEFHTGWSIVPPPAALPAIDPPPASDPTSEEPSAPPHVGTDLHIPKEQENIMANYKEALSKLDSLDGFIGACLCDIDSGMVLATEGGGTLNLEVAGASNVEVIRAKRKAAKNLNLKDDIEDVLISLGKQYHLIRPLKSRPNVFFYLALDRTRANLGMARITLADAERDLVL